jgi:putative oxidoreductase
LTLILVGAIGLVHWQNGFFMNWGGQAAGEGFEYHLLMVALGVVLMVRGGGSWSIDGLLTKRH